MKILRATISKKIRNDRPRQAYPPSIPITRILIPILGRAEKSAPSILLQLLSTGEVPVQFNDVEAINAALEEAEFIAKKQILELKEGVNLSSSIKGKLSTKQGTTIKVGGKKSQDFEKNVETVRNWTETSKGSLRGIGIVGDCYTKDNIVRVTVGFKDDFLQKGDALRDKMDKNLLKTLFKKRTDGDAFVNTYTTNLNTTESYSNSSRLKDLN